MIKQIQILLFFTLLGLSSLAQKTNVGNGAFTSGNFGPIRTETAVNYYSRFAFIYPEGTLTNLKHGDSIAAISFQHRSFDTLKGLCNLKVYLKATNRADFGSGTLNWLAESRNDMVKIFDGSPIGLIKNSPREVLFKLPQSYRWDTTGGKRNFEILVEYTQNTNQASTFNWYVETSATVSGFVSSNESKFIYGNSAAGMDSITSSSSSIHPTLTIYHPSAVLDLSVNQLYGLGTIPLLMKSTDSLKVRVSNVGKHTISNHQVYLNISGANDYKDTVSLSKLNPFEETFVYFTGYKPSNIGTDSIEINAQTDSNTTNNTLQKNRVVNYNVYSHSDPFLPSSGGIGFTGGTGDFVAKFYVDGTSFINQIKVDFSTTGLQFQLVVWDADTNGLPGNELFVSDTSLTIPGTFIMNVLPRISVNSSFYVGIRQASTTNVGFSYQTEVPVRPHTFYFTAPAGNTSWTSFSPGFDFNFNIQPRLQVANDLGVLNIVSPKPDSAYNYHVSDSLDVIVQFINYGYQNQTHAPVSINLVNQFGTTELTRQSTTGISAGDTSTVNFGKISKFRLGKYTLNAFINLAKDSITDNNTKAATFSFVKDHDVAVDQIYSPSNGTTFNMQHDPVQMVVRAINYGVKDQKNLTVRMELVNQDDSILILQDKIVDLDSGATRIIPFDTIYLPDNGDLTLRAFTMLAIDSFPSNDTMQIVINSRKVDDLMIMNVQTPVHQGYYSKDTTIIPYINYRNDGFADQDSARIFIQVTDAFGQLVYADSVIQDAPQLTDKQALFVPYLLDSIGTYDVITWVYIDDDQVATNDTLKTRFSVVARNDLQLVELITPSGTVPAGSTSLPLSIAIMNQGNLAATQAKILATIIDNHSIETYKDSLYVDLQRLTLDTFDFSPVLFDTIGDYSIKVINMSNVEDNKNQGDTLFGNYGVRYQQDLALQRHINPSDGDTLELVEMVYPSLQILNASIDTMRNILVVVDIENGQQVVHTDTFELDYLSPNRAHNFNATTPWIAMNPLVYKMKSYLFNTDDFSDNDTMISSFEVVKRKDILIDSVELPNGDLFKGQVYSPKVRIKNDGLEDLTAVDVSCTVLIGTQQIYQANEQINLEKGKSMTVGFDSSLVYTTEAKAKASFSVNYVGDQVTENDTLSTHFAFVKGLGVGNTVTHPTFVYPNPFDNMIHIISKDKPIESLRLLDLNGRVILQRESINSVDYQLQLNVNPGSYILEFISGGKLKRYPVVKE